MHLSSFSQTYAEARERFAEAARDRGASLTSFTLSGRKGPAGEQLATDVARSGPAPGEADAVLFINSATHGVEGFCGSGCQVEILRTGMGYWGSVAIVLVHALNPFGFAHERRVNESNVDLNRNFVDHRLPPRDHPDYAGLHPHLVPSEWDGPAREAADEALRGWRGEHGEQAYQAAVSRGQYRHADGLFYGGTEPAWSNLLWRGIIDTHSRGCRRIGFIDLHTGLGPNGHGELIHTGSTDDPGFARATAWYGSMTSTEDGTSASAPVRGALAEAFGPVAGIADVTPVVLEFGTVPIDEMLEAVRADNWLHSRAGPKSSHFRPIKRQIRAAFYDERPSWKAMVAERTLDVVNQALRGLNG